MRAGYPLLQNGLDKLPHDGKGKIKNFNDGNLATLSGKTWCDNEFYVYHLFTGRFGDRNERLWFNYLPFH